MAQWFFSRADGKAQGPQDDLGIAALVAAGKLSSSDLIYREGDDRWRPLSDVSAFAPALAEFAKGAAPKVAPGSDRAGSAVAAAPSEDGQASWVLLKRKSEPGKKKSFEQLGPFSQAQIVRMLAEGQASYSDYVWRQGFDKWARIGDRSEFERRPIDLPAIPDVESDFEFDGPTAKTVSAEIAAASVERMSRPQTATGSTSEPAPDEADGVDLLEERTVIRMSPREAAHPSSSSQKVSPVAMPSNSAASLGNRSAGDQDEDPEKTFVRPRVPVSRPVPPRVPSVESMPVADVREAVTDPRSRALGNTGNDFPRPNSHRDALGVSSSGGATSIAPSDRARRPLRRIALWAGAAGVVAGLAAAIWIWSSSGEKPIEPRGSNPGVADAPSAPPAPPPQPRPEVAQPAPSPASHGQQGAAASSAPPADPVDAPISARLAAGSGPTTTLELVPIGLESGTPRIFLKTNAPVGVAIEFSIKGRSGEILEASSFTKSVQIKRPASQVLEVEIAGWSLPTGRYEVSASAEGISRSQVMFIGAKTKGFSTALEAHLKHISAQQQVERKALFHGAKRLGSLARSVSEASRRSGGAKTWKAFYAGWKSDFAQAKQKVVHSIEPFKGKLAYGDEFQALSAATARLKRFAETFDGDPDVKRATASASEPQSIEEEFKRLRSVAAQLSSRRDR